MYHFFFFIVSSLFVSKGKFFLVLFILLFHAVLRADLVYVDGKKFLSLHEASKSMKDGSKVYIKAGRYNEGMYISANNIHILGEKGVIFDGAIIDGKGALVLTGNNVLVENVECRNIYVDDLNGACIRFEGNNLTARNIYAHNSQSGVMTNYNNGFLRIEYSTFENLGGKASGKGYAHAVYANVGEFTFSHSKILSVRDEGSGIKSRSRKTLIDNSILASMDAKDSRLVDVADYGELIIKNSVLQQGDNTSNSQLIAYGLENTYNNYAVNRIELKNNLFLLDRQRTNIVLTQRGSEDTVIENNLFIGSLLRNGEYSERNTWYLSREKAKLKAYPYLPTIDELPLLINSIKIIGEQQ